MDSIKNIVNSANKLSFDNLRLASHQANVKEIIEICRNIFGYLENNQIREFTSSLSKYLQNEIETTQIKIRAINEEIKEIQQLSERHAELKQQGQNLESELKKLVSQKSEIENLKLLKSEIEQLQEFLKSNNFENLNSENTQKLKTVINILGTIKNKILKDTENIKNEIQNAQAELHQLITDYEVVNSQNVEIKKQVVETENNIKSTTKDINIQNNILETRKKEYKELFVKIDSLKSEIKKVQEVHSENKRIFQDHFEANKKIWGAITEKGILENYVSKEICPPIEKLLSDFDKVLSDIIKNRDKINPLEYNETSK